MRTSRLAIGLVAVAAFVRLALAAVIPLFPDEAYYWDWSRHIAAGYFDHPPAVALLIRAGTTILGNTPLGVRAGSVLAGIVATLAIMTIALRLGAARNADPDYHVFGPLDDVSARAALLLLVIPGALIGFVVATPDAALLAAAALTLAALERVLASPAGSRAALGWWCAAGLTLGIAFSSKYTAVLLPLGTLIAMVSRRDLRKRLAEPGPYIGTLISLIVFAPNLLWNSRHAWISFAFQLHHGLGQTHGTFAGREIALIGGQLGIISPVIAVIAVIAVARSLRAIAEPRRYMLAVIATTVIVFFAMSALRRPVEPNWPVLALVAALPLLGTMELAGRLRAWFSGGVMLAAALTFLVAAQAATRVFHMDPRRDPVSKAHGWSDLSRAVSNAESRAAGCRATWIAADRYQDAAELAFTLPGRPRVFALNLGGRPNQYDLWPSLYSVASSEDCALVIVDEGAGGQAVVRRFGADSAAIAGDAVLAWVGDVIGRRAIWLVRGIPQAAPAPVALSPIAAAALSAAVVSDKARSPLLDSLVSLYRRGPVPNIVTTSAAAPLSNADGPSAISSRINSLHSMLQRSGFMAVYRDARYRECTFVRLSVADSTEIGYVSTPDGCKLSSGRDDRVLRVEPSRPGWFAYAAPERRSY